MGFCLVSFHQVTIVNTRYHPNIVYTILAFLQLILYLDLMNTHWSLAKMKSVQINAISSNVWKLRMAVGAYANNNYFGCSIYRAVIHLI